MSSVRTGGNVSQLQDKVDVVKTQMQHNVDSALQRGEALESLQSQAANIDVEAKHFQKTSRTVKRREQCKHCRLWFLLIAIIGVIVFVIILIIVIVAVVLSQ